MSCATHCSVHIGEHPESSTAGKSAVLPLVLFDQIFELKIVSSLYILGRRILKKEN